MTDTWKLATTLSKLEEGGCKVFRVSGKQIALFRREGNIYACNNRCPHEGYPLSEGDLDGDRVLTCNWHNWKFNLESGENLYGGDRLRVYPVEIRGDEVWIDLAEPPTTVRVAEIMMQLRETYDDDDYQRLARELARLSQVGADPRQAVTSAVLWSHDHLEFGATHAQAAAPDWLALRDGLARSEAERLVPVTEIVGHLAWDSLREPAYPFPQGLADYDPEALVHAIEREDDAAPNVLQASLQVTWYTANPAGEPEGEEAIR